MNKINFTLLGLALLTQTIQADADDFLALSDIPAENLSHQEMQQVEGQYIDVGWLVGWMFIAGKLQGQTNSEAAKGALITGVAATVLNNSPGTQTNPIILPPVQQTNASSTPEVQIQPVQYRLVNILPSAAVNQNNFTSASGSCGSSFSCMVQQQADLQLQNKGYTGATDPRLAQEIELSNQAALSGNSLIALQTKALISNTTQGAFSGRGIRNPDAMMGAIAAQDLSSRLTDRFVQHQ